MFGTNCLDINSNYRQTVRYAQYKSGFNVQIYGSQNKLNTY